MKKIQFLPFYFVGLLAIALSCGKSEPDPTPPVTPPTPVAPSNLVYSTNSLTACQNEAKNSVTPTITGTPAPTFEATVNPTNPGITIDNVTGRIQVSITATTGTFKVSVKATNSAGNQTFADIYTVNITAPNPSGVNYDEEVLTLVTQNCAPCHVAGGSQTRKWDDFNTARSGINSMLTRVENGTMPPSGKLSDDKIKILRDWVANCLIK
jgi:mono/diheme cytochrome c family protein